MNHQQFFSDACASGPFSLSVFIGSSSWLALHAQRPRTSSMGGIRELSIKLLSRNNNNNTNTNTNTNDNDNDNDNDNHNHNHNHNHNNNKKMMNHSKINTNTTRTTTTTRR